MKLIQMNEYVQTAAALVAIVGIFLLGYELRLSNKFAKADAIREVTTTTEHYLGLLENPGVIEIVQCGLSDFSALSTKEQVLFHAHFYPMFVHIESVYEMYSLGLVDKHHYDGWLAAARGVAGSPGGSQWWLYAQQGFPPVFASTINRSLENEGFSLKDRWPWFACG